MAIKRVAAKRRKEMLYSLNSSDGKFYPWAEGDLATVDRFLSNFHKPLQRRMLHISPETIIPSSGVIRVQSTQEIYIISEPRDDAQNNESYDRLCVLHHISGESGGAVQFYNYEIDDTKPTSSVAELVRTSIGLVYLAVEYFSSKKTENSDEYYEGKFVMYAPIGTPIKKNGVFTLNGIPYKVLQTYTDSSYACALLLQQDDDMQSLKYYDIGSGSGYDVTTGALTLNEDEYLFSGTEDFDTLSDSGARKSIVYIKSTNLPFTPKSGRYIANVNGDKSKILKASKDINAGGQIKLECEGV